VPNVRVVTDSAADIPAELAASRGIRIVPLTIRFGQEAFVDGVELTTADFWAKLRTSTDFPATAAPSAGDFEQVYRELVAEGADGIVSVHLSSKLSATYQSAVLASRSVPDVDVQVVDSLAVTAATGLLALQAAELAGGGATAKEIAEELVAMRATVRLYGVLDTLEYLRRGGRIGSAQALLGTMLQVKPVVTLSDGVVEPAGRVRTRQKALQHLAGIVKQAGNVRRLVIVNGDAHDLDAFQALLTSETGLSPEDIWMLGPVVGTHTGPGLIGAVFTTA
jgi:DegV family protein with EDD domain